MPAIDLSLIITLAIFLLVLGAAAKWGRLNPENTGRISTKVVSLEAEIGALKDKVGACATTSALSLVATKLQELEEQAASSGEILALEVKINVIGEKVAGVKETGDRTWQAIDRMQNYFMEEGIKRMGGKS